VLSDIQDTRGESRRLIGEGKLREHVPGIAMPAAAGPPVVSDETPGPHGEAADCKDPSGPLRH
jgi:hypothetical protein